MVGATDDIAAALAAAGPRPATLGPQGQDNRVDKRNYAQRLSDALAPTVADALRPAYRRARVTPYADGQGRELSIGGAFDRKRTDVGVWDDTVGLVAGVSIKTYSFRDTHGAKDGAPAWIGRYSRNVKRNDLELRDEAATLHRRQPWAVLVALFFLPVDACWDGAGGHSSFAHVVFTLRKRAGRTAPEGPAELFERVYVGLVEPDGAVGFFDVAQAPPYNQPPPVDATRTLTAVIERLDDDITRRNLGVSKNELYASADPMWQPPAGSVPTSVSKEAALDVDAALSAAESSDEPGEVT